MREIFKIITLLFVTSLTACQGLDDAMQGEDFTDYGNIELTFHGTTRATTTTISPEEAQHFLITITQGERIVRGPEALGTIDLRLPVGQGYKVYAESCSKEDAENSNEHWGQKRFTGSSAEFGINKGETTKVKVGMSVVNASLCVIINPSLSNYFKKSCTVTLSDADRGLIWNYDNAGKTENGVSTDGQVAYFNVNEGETRTIHYTIIVANDNKTITKEGTVSLSRAKMVRLNLAYDSGFFNLTVKVNDDDLYVNNELNLGPENIIQDDGATDAIGGNDDFHTDGTEVDYDQYN
jgi:hypothetical protein